MIAKIALTFIVLGTALLPVSLVVDSITLFGAGLGMMFGGVGIGMMLTLWDIWRG